MNDAEKIVVSKYFRDYQIQFDYEFYLSRLYSGIEILEAKEEIRKLKIKKLIYEIKK